MTWLLPEFDVGVELGALRPLDDELLDVPVADDELFEVPELDAACRVLAAVAPGRANATPPAAIRLAAVAVRVAARSRARPRSLAAAPGGVLCLCWLMAASVPLGSRWPLRLNSQAAMSASQHPGAGASAAGFP